MPGPVAYGRGGTEATVTDANVVLGYLPEALLGGTMQLDRAGARRAVQKIADALGLDLMRAAAGIIDIVNENMFGALRLVSVQQGYDPREFALMAFGGAGPLHANALGRLMGSWPVIIPPSPGVLCAYGDATTRMRVESQRSFNRLAQEIDDSEIAAVLDEIAAEVAADLDAEGVPAKDHEYRFKADVRYAGQAFEIPLAIVRADFADGAGLAGLMQAFDAEHRRLFTFNLDAPQEIVNLRVAALGRPANVTAEVLPGGDGNPARAKLRDHELWIDGGAREAAIYARDRLRAGDRIPGPAILVEMDSTTLVLADHVAEVDDFGNVLITPA